MDVDNSANDLYWEEVNRQFHEQKPAVQVIKEDTLITPVNLLAERGLHLASEENKLRNSKSEETDISRILKPSVHMPYISLKSDISSKGVKEDSLLAGLRNYSGLVDLNLYMKMGHDKGNAFFEIGAPHTRIALLDLGASIKASSKGYEYTTSFGVSIPLGIDISSMIDPGSYFRVLNFSETRDSLNARSTIEVKLYELELRNKEFPLKHYQGFVLSKGEGWSLDAYEFYVLVNFFGLKYGEVYSPIRSESSSFLEQRRNSFLEQRRRLSYLEFMAKLPLSEIFNEKGLPDISVGYGLEDLPHILYVLRDDNEIPPEINRRVSFEIEFPLDHLVDIQKISHY